MKAKIESTDRVVTVVSLGSAEARVWEGVTDAGIPFTAYIAMVQVRKEDDNAEFERELKEHKQPARETVRAIGARFII